MTEQITLYTSKICPYAHRAELALKEVNADYTQYEIDLFNKPEWYAPRVNPASKVPAIAYGGPKVAPENPSRESVKLAESLILAEFVADLYPDSDLLPKDPVARAKARFFIDVVSTKFTPVVTSFIISPPTGLSFEPVLEAFAVLQNNLPPVNEGKFVLGDKFTLADISVAPFLGRHLLVSLKHGIGRFDKEDGKKVWEALQDSKYERLWQYVNAISERQSWKDTFAEAYLVEAFTKRLSA